MPHVLVLLLLHLVESLLLIFGENGLDLSVGILMDFSHLAELVLPCDGRIVAERLHLCVLVFENSLYFCLLVVTEIQLLGKVLELFVHTGHLMMSAHSMTTRFRALRRGSLLTLIVLTESGSGAKQETYRECQCGQYQS